MRARLASGALLLCCVTGAGSLAACGSSGPAPATGVLRADVLSVSRALAAGNRSAALSDLQTLQSDLAAAKRDGQVGSAQYARIAAATQALAKGLASSSQSSPQSASQSSSQSSSQSAPSSSAPSPAATVPAATVPAPSARPRSPATLASRVAPAPPPRPAPGRHKKGKGHKKP